MHKLTLTVPEAGKALGIGRTAAYEAARARQLPTIRIGKRLLVPVIALERLLTGSAPAANKAPDKDEKSKRQVKLDEPDPDGR